MAIDDRTPALNLPLPHKENQLQDDVGRIRSSFAAVDAWVAAGGSIHYAAAHGDLPASGADKTLYITKDVGRFFRWNGVAYVVVGSPESTDDVAEGAGNLYFTEARARAAAGVATANATGMVRVGAGLSVGLDGQLSVVGAAGAGGVPAFTELTMVPTANGQKDFSPNGGYTTGMIDVHVNGIFLFGNGDDYTATNGTNIVLTVGVNTTDTVMLRRWTTSNNFPFSALTGKPTKQAGYGLNEIRGATTSAVTYDGNGRVSTVTDSIDGANKVTTFAYNADGTIKTATTVYLGLTRVETYAYASGKISGYTATEVQA